MLFLFSVIVNHLTNDTRLIFIVFFFSFEKGNENNQTTSSHASLVLFKPLDADKGFIFLRGVWANKKCMKWMTIGMIHTRPSNQTGRFLRESKPTTRARFKTGRVRGIRIVYNEKLDVN